MIKDPELGWEADDLAMLSIARAERTSHQGRPLAAVDCAVSMLRSQSAFRTFAVVSEPGDHRKRLWQAAETLPATCSLAVVTHSTSLSARWPA